MLLIYPNKEYYEIKLGELNKNPHKLLASIEHKIFSGV